MALIKPKLQEEELLKDILTFNDTQGFKFWWLGQSGFLISWQGKHLLFDPYLSDSLTIKYQHTDKPHVRMSELVIAPDKLDFIDIVTSSHNHTDHLDADTLIPILNNNPDIRFVIPEANRSFVADRVKCAEDFPEGLNDGLLFEHKGFRIHGVPAAHNDLERNDKGECKFMGFVVEFGGFSVYHSGDTIWYEGIVEILKPFRLDVAFLPINGNKPERKIAGNLNPEEAVRLGRETGAKWIVPHHYDLFEFNTADPLDFIQECWKFEVDYKVPELGEGIVYPALPG